MLIINVENGNIQQALKKYKRKYDDSNIVKELRDRQTFTKPSVTKRLQKEEAVRKNLKRLKKEDRFKNLKNIPKKFAKV